MLFTCDFVIRCYGVMLGRNANEELVSKGRIIESKLNGSGVTLFWAKKMPTPLQGRQVLQGDRYSSDSSTSLIN